jgi:hypothetical protein
MPGKPESPPNQALHRTLDSAGELMVWTPPRQWYLIFHMGSELIGKREKSGSDDEGYTDGA